jgi:tRNA modification GTPase
VVALVLEGAIPDVEIQGHGGLAVTTAILRRLETEGVVIVDSKRDPEELCEFIARADTLRVAGILLDQEGDAFEREIAEIEATLDRERLNHLTDRVELGERLLTGWRVVLTGRPNVGKSRLLNALAGFDRAIVSPQPGTTRDVVTIRTAIDGWPVEIADTAGIREQAAGVESAGIARAKQVSSEADLLVLVLDRSEPLRTEDLDLIEANPDCLRVANKSDLSAAWAEEDVCAIAVSAETGDGLDGLLHAISRRIVPEPPPKNAVVPFRKEHFRRLHETQMKCDFHQQV